MILIAEAVKVKPVAHSVAPLCCSTLKPLTMAYNLSIV